MDHGNNKKRRNLQVDRLSSLPNHLIHKILSFLGLKYAVQTIVLSSRYRFIWTSMPYLNFSAQDFSSLPKFSKFVTSFMRRRNNLLEVSSVKLDFRGKLSQGFVNKILDYAFSHNVQQMTFKYLPDKEVKFPLSLFSSKQSLKHLTLSGHYLGPDSILITSTWDLPALTTLYLEYIKFDDVITDNKRIDLFSKCPNLKNLTLKDCSMSGGSDGVDICHPRISDLTLENIYINVLNVVASELKNLTIRNCSGVHLLSAPMLVSLVLKGQRQFQFSSKSLCSLEKVDLCFDVFQYQKSSKEYAESTVGMLQQLHNAKFLTVNLEIIQLLSSSVELILHQPSPFKNLKRLIVYPQYDTYSKVQETIPTEVKNYLLDSSLGATFTQVSCEEIIALRNAKSAQKLMAKLRVMLEQENDNTETSTSHTDQEEDGTDQEEDDTDQEEDGTDQEESNEESMPEQRKSQPVEKMQVDFDGRMADIKRCWNDVGVQIERGKKKASRIISKLRDIEVLLLTLTKLPKSKRDKLQACFSSLRLEVDAGVKKIIDRMKTQCDGKQIRLSDCIREFATTSHSES